MSDAEQTKFAERFEEIEKYLVEFLKFIEENTETPRRLRGPSRSNFLSRI
jgi:hypothetical protein